MKIKSMFRVLFVVIIAVKIVAAQLLEHHRQFLCDEAGSKDGIRVLRTLDFVNCKRKHGEEYCSRCRCEFFRFWQIAEPCFREDEDFAARMAISQQRWQTDFVEKCSGGSELEALDFSLEPGDVKFCNGCGKGIQSFSLCFILFFFLEKHEIPA